MLLSSSTIILLLFILTIILIFIVYGKNGYRPILSLLVTISIIISIVIPLLIKNYNPILVVFVSAIPITIFTIYITEGLSTLSGLSIVLTLINFFFVSLLTYVSISISNLTGFNSETAAAISGEYNINMTKLFIATIMLGTLGALIEMVVTQVGTVIELMNSNPKADKKEIYKRAYKIGTIHLGSIINTLFLIYAGVLLSALIYFSGSKDYLDSLLNIEPISSEIIKILIGAIGLIVAMPISTFFAIKWLRRKSFK